MTPTPMAIVQAFYDGLGRGTMDFELIDPEIRWRTPASLPWTPDGQTERGGIVEYRGLEEFGGYLQALLREIDGMRAEADGFLADGDRVVVLGREFGRVRHTGKEFAAPFAHVLTVEAGRIKQLHGYIDTAMLAEAFQISGGRPSPSTA